MRIISLIDCFRIGNGATSAITTMNEFYIQRGIEHFVFYDYAYGICPNYVFVYKKELLLSLIENGENVLVHYYLSGGMKGNGIFHKVINCLKENGISVPILTTVLQKPSYAYCMLTPFVIRNSNHIVFIDKASYNDSLYSFIPAHRKSMFYCSFPIPKDKIKHLDKLAESRLEHKKEERFVYGRGSVINKCPKDTIEVFNQIDVTSKHFIICGVGDDSWIAKKASHCNNITTYPNKTFKEWELICSTFDVFLYYLPEDTYSSLDGNLGLAMKLGIPPIVYGPDAPKERIIHGVNGFIANTKDDIVKYAKMLYDDDELRGRIGKNARDMTYKMLHNNQTIDGYNDLYNLLLTQKREFDYSIPVSLSLICFIKRTLFMMKFYKDKFERAMVLLFKNPANLIKKINNKYHA